MRPAAVLDGEILEFDGSFQVPAISGLSHFAEGNQLMRRKQLDAALLEFKTATQLDPEFISAHEMLATLYAQRKQTDPALAEYETAMHIYKTVHPEYQAFNKPPANPLAQH